MCQAQSDQTRAAIREIVGPVDLMLRPPYGFVDDTLRQWAKAPIICWSLYSRVLVNSCAKFTKQVIL